MKTIPLLSKFPSTESVCNDLIQNKIQEFSPNQDNFEYRERKDEDLQLSVSPEIQEIFEKQKLMIPILSNTD